MTTRPRPAMPDIFASTDHPAVDLPPAAAASRPAVRPAIKTRSSVVYLTEGHMAYLRSCKILALQRGVRDVSATAVVRYAMDQLILAYTPERVVDLVTGGNV